MDMSFYITFEKGFENLYICTLFKEPGYGMSVGEAVRRIRGELGEAHCDQWKTRKKPSELILPTCHSHDYSSDMVTNRKGPSIHSSLPLYLQVPLRPL